MNKFFKLLIVFLFLGLLIPEFSNAQQFLESSFRDAEKIAGGAGYALTSDDEAQADLIDTIVNLIRIALGFIGTILTVLFLYAGWKYMTAGGNADQVQDAVKWMKNAIIGILIILMAYAFSSFILRSIIESVF